MLTGRLWEEGKRTEADAGCDVWKAVVWEKAEWQKKGWKAKKGKSSADGGRKGREQSQTSIIVSQFGTPKSQILYYVSEAIIS